MTPTLTANVDRVIAGDVEHGPFPFPDGYFDCILTLDVLEHLVEPARVLAECRRVLKPTGTLVISIPNSQHYEVILRLISGELHPQPFGILDYTHLHVYTRKTIVAMLIASGFTVKTYRRTFQPVLYRSKNQLIRKLQNGFSRVGGSKTAYKIYGAVPMLRDWLTFQYLVAVSPGS
ncbi:MAG: hypothetical protein NVS4B8_21270 [Herpetosiphon sp.]